MRELSHAVEVQFQDGAAQLTVRRTIRNDGLTYRSLSHTFSLPDGAVVTSLRVGQGGQWLAPATLATRDEAQDRWDLLISPGSAAPATLGLLRWSWDRGVDFDLFGIPPSSTVEVQYGLTLATKYEAGEVSFTYPRERGEGWLDPTFEAGALQQVEVLPEEAESNEVKVRRAWATRELADVRWATFPVDSDRTLWRLEIDAAAQLERAPARPNVVFVVDASHSEGEEGIAAQLELIAPYLVNASDAEVEVVLYRRAAERLFGRFIPAREVAQQLAAVPAERLAPGNGSHLELGAGLAAELLAVTPGVGRVVLFTDEQLRDGFTNELAASALARLPSDAVLHVVYRGRPWGEQLSESRDDDAQLAPLAAGHGGIFLRVGGHATDPVLSADTLVGLVRPVRIDDFRVEAAGLEEDLLVDDVLPEGQAVRTTAVSAAPPEEVVVSGKVWAREFKRVVRVDRALADRLPAYAVGDDAVRGVLSDDELRTVAFVAGAVSPVTSYLSAPPNAAPSTEGVDTLLGRDGLGLRGFGCSGCGTSSRCGWSMRGRAPDYDALLRALLAPGVAACEAQLGQSASTAVLTLEATGDEVVDVSASADTEAMRGCLVEAAWALRLGSEFTAHHTWSLPLAPTVE